MEKPNTPTPLPKYPTKNEMVNPIETNISVKDINLFRTFLDANDMQNVVIGYYSYRPKHVKYIGYFENMICYTNENPSELIENNLMYMRLKFGGLVDAFKHFKKQL